MNLKTEVWGPGESRFTCLKGIKVLTELSSGSKTSKHKDLIPGQSETLTLQGRGRGSAGFDRGPVQGHWNRAEIQNLDPGLGPGSRGPDRCWRPWGRRSESRSVLLRKRRCCLQQRRSWVWGSGGPRRWSLRTPRSGTLLETRDTSQTWYRGRGPVLLVLKLTDIEAEDPWKTLRDVRTGRSPKQVQPAFNDTEGGNRIRTKKLWGLQLQEDPDVLPDWVQRSELRLKTSGEL